MKGRGRELSERAKERRSESEGPVFGFKAHVDKHGDDVIIFIVQRSVCWLVNILAFECIIKPYLGFGGFTF